jgi:pyrophosphate--fructose-6-phosphate 1-phosphotransferase
MSSKISVLQQARAGYQPRLPAALKGGSLKVEQGEATQPATDVEAIHKLFPRTFGQPLIQFVPGEGAMATHPLRVGVILSGGPAPGGHNVIAGLFDALKAANPDSRLFGFRQGPIGVINGDSVELTAAIIDSYRNTGGFDMIMSGRDKIEGEDRLKACRANLESMSLDGLVIIGGDDSNTNAAVLAEYLKAKNCQATVVGVPKTIDGDMKNEHIEASFGFDTAARTYSELIGNICRDAMSSVKYWHFVRLMGRAASHIVLECALQTHPNVALISEEIQATGQTLRQVVETIADAVAARAKNGKHYGVVLVPEGLLEFVPEVSTLIKELGRILKSHGDSLDKLASHEERLKRVLDELPAGSRAAYELLPSSIQATLLTRDSHGNVPLSQVETERLLIDMVKARLDVLQATGEASTEFVGLSHFLGYEGRCAAPSNFDTNYCYSLGHTAAQLIRAGVTGYTCSIRNLTKPSDEWVAGGVPVTMMLNMEDRRGESVPVIKKALVDLGGSPFKSFAAQRSSWVVRNEYQFPGPIQYFGPPEVCEAPTLTLQLERSQVVPQ